MMETSSAKPRVNMALKLEMWLASKNQASVAHQAPPLRPVVFKSDQRRVSGYYNKVTTGAAASAPAASPVTVVASVVSPSPSSTLTKKTFSRLKTSASMEALEHIATATAMVTTNKPASPITVAKSPSHVLGKKGPAPLNHAKSPAAVATTDEGTKENEEPGRPVTSDDASLSFDIEFANVEIRGKSSKSDRRKSMMLTIDVENIPRADPLESSAGSPLDPPAAVPAPAVTNTNTSTIISTNSSFGVHGLSATDVEALIRRNQELEQRAEEAEAHAANLQEELHAMLFLNSVQEQQIGELHDVVSRERQEINEALSVRTRKHRMEVKRLAAERASYEERANQMVTQMGEQMALLQQMAMGRIETLEADLMAERHRAEALQQEVGSLRMQARIQQQKQGQVNACVVDDDGDDGDDDDDDLEDDVGDEAEKEEEDEDDEDGMCGDYVDGSLDCLPAMEVIDGRGVCEEKEVVMVAMA